MNTPFMAKQNRLGSKNRRVYFTYLTTLPVSTQGVDGRGMKYE
jgi:hypothetical protein